MAMAYERAAEEIITAARLMYEHRLLVGFEGNLSARLDDGRFLSTPRGRCKGLLEPSHLVLVDAEGHALSGGEASTEFAMHRTIYEQRPDLDAVVHGHPVHCTALAAAGRSLCGCVLPEMVLTIGRVPLAEYATPSTPEVGASLRELVRDHDAVLLRNHGVVVGGRSVLSAFHALESVEQWAQIEWTASFVGGVQRLSRTQVEALREIAGVYGLPRRAPDCLAEGESDADGANA